MKEPALNLPCKICNKKIKISEGTLIEHRPLHFSCYKNQAKRECWEEELYFLRLIYEGSVTFQHECHHSYEEVGKRIEELKKNLEMTESVK